MSANGTTVEDTGVEPQTESSDATEHLKLKLARINNELQDTMKICENYKENKQTAEKHKTELEESKRKITDLERRLADSESHCKRYRNERNNLRRDIARLIDERKEMISYEQDVQKLQRDIEMLKNKYNCDIREWKNKLSDAENKYEDIIKEERLKAETAEQEVQTLRKELETNCTENGQDKQTVSSKETVSGMSSHDAKHLSNETDKPDELVATGGIHVKGQMGNIKRDGNTSINDIDGKYDENTDDHNIGTNDDPDSLNNVTGNDKQYTNDDEKDDDYDGDDKKYKIKRHKVIKEYRTIESKEPEDDPDAPDDPNENSKDTNGDIIEKSHENPDEVVEEAETTNRATGKNEVAVEDPTQPNETQSGDNLADMYQQLYGNQWKNTYEKLKHHFKSDLDTVTALLEILQDIMTFCKRKAHEQIEDMYRILTFSTEQSEENISEKMTKHLKDCMREISSEAKTYLYELYPSSFRKKPSHPADYNAIVVPFVKECFEICWLIVIQDDPLEFKPFTNDNDELDSDVYNSYRNTGQYINYVVWPSLQCTNDGSVFAKGVAETSDTRQRRRHEVSGLDIDVNKDRSFKILNDDNELIDRNDFDEMDGNNITDFHSREGAKRYTRRTNYNHRHEEEFADRDNLSQRDSYNLRERNELVSENHVHPRSRDAFRSPDESDLYRRVDPSLKDKLHFEKRDVTMATTRGDLSNRGVHFSKENEIQEIRQRNHVDSRYDRGYDNRNELIDMDSCNDKRRRENAHTEEQLDAYDSHYYASKDRVGAQPLHAFDLTEETRPSYPMSVIKTKAKGTANVWKPSYGYERDPTPEEMRLYHRYIDNHDHTGARDVLGNATYLRCLRKDHTQPFYR